MRRKIKFLLISILVLFVFASHPAFASSNELDSTVQSIAQQFTKELRTDNESIAIPPFLTLDNMTTMLGKLLSEKLINEFSRSNKIMPVERDFIFKLIDEMKLGMTGFVELKTVQQVGKFSGASYVLVGTVQRVGKNIQVSARLVKTETSKIEKSMETKIKATPDILELLAQEIKTTLIPSAEKEGEQEKFKSDFEKLRKEHSMFQDKLEKLSQQLAQAKDEKERLDFKKQEEETRKAQKINELIAKGDIAVELRDLETAIKIYSKAIAIEPKSVSAYLRRGHAYDGKHLGTLALRDFNKAIELEPESVAAYMRRGALYFRLAEIQSELEQGTTQWMYQYQKERYQSIKQNFPSELVDAKMPIFDRAIADFSKAIESNPAGTDDFRWPFISGAFSQPLYINIYAWRGLSYKRKYEWTGKKSLKLIDMAIEDYTRAIKISPNDSLYYLYRAGAYSLKENYGQAAYDYEQALELIAAILIDEKENPYDDGFYLSILNHKIEALTKNDDFDNVIKECTRMIKMTSAQYDKIQAYEKRSLAYAQKKNYDAAVSDYLKWTELKENEYFDKPYDSYTVFIHRLGSMWSDTSLHICDKPLIPPEHFKDFKDKKLTELHQIIERGGYQARLLAGDEDNECWSQAIDKFTNMIESTFAFFDKLLT